MKIVRVFIALVFFGLIIFAFIKRNQNSQITENNGSYMSIQQTLNKFFAIDRQKNTDHVPSNQGNNDLDGQNSGNTSPRLHGDITQGTLSESSFHALTENTRSIGPKKAPFALFIRCDYDTVYCKQFFEDSQVTAYQLAFQDKLEVFFKGYATNSTGVKNTYNSHHARLCAEKLATGPQRTRLQKYLFNNPHESIETIVEKGDTIGIQGFAGCLLTQNSNQRLETQKLQAKNLFSIRVLPSLVFYNKTSRQWFLIPGYYSQEEIEDSFAVILQSIQ